MSKTTTIIIDAGRYEDEEDCLTAAAEAAMQALDLDGWDLAPRYADDDTREEIILTVPAPSCNDAAGWDALRMFAGCPSR